MGQLFEAVVDYLNEDDWKYNIVKDDTALVLSFRGRSGSWQCFANVDEEHSGSASSRSFLPTSRRRNGPSSPNSSPGPTMAW